ncbi:Conserved hypothetical protein [gamma proteobacterium HdN1]|nr:Conserved hypothetical protein [gamma proteobacterium HdN1]
MHENNILSLRDEAKRLLEKEIELFETVRDSPGLLERTTGKQKKAPRQTLDEQSVNFYLEMFHDEIIKLDKLDLILAVVGTMKAGKSTTINAIVGMEVLPNRNRPMTSLPTLIRHTLGTTIPKLVFNHVKPVNDLLAKLNKIAKPANSAFKELKDDSETQALIQRIEDLQFFSIEHNGSEEIFNFLKDLNDLVRVATSLDVEFPYAEYSSIDQLPVIEVEFTHLKEMGNLQGSITLLDTPGPNEAGQEKFKNMLTVQLQKASAVLAILDYTQLKSEADNEIRDRLKELSEVTGDRLYALVNKFDQKDRNSDNAQQVKQYVSKSLMEGVLSDDRIFPVSSRLGFLASTAKNEMLVNQALPYYKTNPWVEDFAQEVFGRRWETKINNQEDVEIAIQELWDDSQFGDPLNRVIRDSYSKAAILAVQSSTAKLIDVTEKAQNFIGILCDSFSRSVNELQTEIKSLQNDVDRIKTMEDETIKDVKNALVNVLKNVIETKDKHQNNIEATLNKYFKEGKLDEKTRADQKNTKEKEAQTKRNIFSPLFGNERDDPTRAIWEESYADKRSKTITYTDESSATDMKRRIGVDIDSVFESIKDELPKSINDELEKFNNLFGETIKASNSLIQEIVDRNSSQDKDVGFKLRIRPPSTSRLKFNVSAASLMREAINEKSRSVTRRRRKDSVWGGICRFFNTDDWGWESYESEEKIYVLDIQKLNKEILEKMTTVFEKFDDVINTDIKSDIESVTGEFFNYFRGKIEQIREDRIRGLNERQKSKDEQADLIKTLKELGKPIPKVLSDAKELEEDVNNFLNDTEAKIA